MDFQQELKKPMHAQTIIMFKWVVPSLLVHVVMFIKLQIRMAK